MGFGGFSSLLKKLQWSWRRGSKPTPTYLNSCVVAGDTCAPLPRGIACCNAEPGTSSSWRGGERFTGQCVMPPEQHLKDLQHRWRAEMLQGHKTWKNETAGRALQPSELSFITQGPDKGWRGEVLHRVLRQLNFRLLRNTPCRGLPTGAGTSERTSCGLQVSA